MTKFPTKTFKQQSVRLSKTGRTFGVDAADLHADQCDGYNHVGLAGC